MKNKFTFALVAMIAVATFGYAAGAPLVTNAAATFSISCTNVVVSGSTWTLSGTWSVGNNFPGQASQYDVAVYAPTSTLADDSSKDAPDTFVTTTQNGGISMSGTWSNQIIFASGTPSAIGAKLYHAGVSGGEASGDALCHFVLPPQLTLVKHVVNDNGGTASSTAWTLAASGATPISGTTGSASVTNASVTAGTYTLSESGGPSGYTPSLYSCSKNGGAAVNSNSITLANGDSAICTITNDDNAPTTATLHVVKNVVNSFGGLRTSSGFTIHVTNASSSPSSFSGSAAGTDVTVTPGSYSVSEDPVVGYAGTFSTDCSGNISAGQTKTCTITNNDIQPRLTVIKTVVNDNGGTKVSSDFTMTLTGVAVATTTFQGSATGTVVGLSAGAYSVNELAVSGYTKTLSNDCAGTMVIGDTRTCTVTNDDQPGTLVIKKVVVNDNGGTKTAANFSFSVNNGGAVSFNANGENDIVVPAGVYSVNETSAPGYTTTYNNCSNMVVANGASSTCIITNDDIQPRLTIVKHVSNLDWGTAAASDFTMQVQGGAVLATTTGSETGTPFLLDAGSYTVSESGPSGYSATFSGACDAEGQVTLAAGDDATCTVTNTDTLVPAPPAHLTVVKHVVNDDGGTKGAADFTMHVEGTNVSDGFFAGSETGTQVTLDAGSYTVSEEGPAGYAETLGDGCTGIIEPNASTTCIITNDDIGSQVSGMKFNDLNGNGQKDEGEPGLAGWVITLSSEGYTASTTTAGDGTYSFTNVPAGTYTVSETPQSGWTQTTPAPAAIVLGLDQTVTGVDFGNIQYASLTITKITDPAGSEDTFTFSIEGGGNHLSTTTSVTGEEGANTHELTSLVAGDYAITELLPEGWTFSSATCGNEDNQSFSNGGTYVLEPGEHAICTFHNSQNGSITVKKVVLGSDGQTIVEDSTPFTVRLNGSTTQSVAEGADATFGNLTAGTYTVSEDPSANYDLVSISPDADGETSGAQVTVSSGETVTVTVTNKQHATVPPPGSGDCPANTICATSGGGGGPATPSTGGGQVLGASTSTVPAPPAPQVLGESCELYLTKFIRPNHPNDPAEVKKLQQFLNKYEGEQLPVTGFYGSLSRAAVNRFQVKFGDDVLEPWVSAGLHKSKSDPTGYVYLTTKRKINLIVCPSLALPIPTLAVDTSK